MAKTRRSRPRYPCGKPRPETASPAVIQSIIDQAKRGAANPLLRSEIGRLRLTDVLDNAQVMAATRFAAICGAYDRAKGLPRRTVASPSYQSGYGSRDEADREDDAILSGLARNGGNVLDMAQHSPRLLATLRATERYELALAALLAVGAKAASAVKDVAVYDEAVATERHHYLRLGLNALIEHFENGA